MTGPSIGRRITLRRTVPHLLDDGAQLTINDMRTEPDRARLVVSSTPTPSSTTVRVGDDLLLSGRTWVVRELTVGARGVVVLDETDR